MAVRHPGAFAELVLIAPLGIKTSDRETRDIVDVFAVTDAEFRQSLAATALECTPQQIDRWSASAFSTRASGAAKHKQSCFHSV